MRIFAGFDQRNWDANKNVENSTSMVLLNGKWECYPEKDINIVNSTGDFAVCPLALPFCKCSAVRIGSLCIIHDSSNGETVVYCRHRLQS